MIARIIRLCLAGVLAVVAAGAATSAKELPLLERLEHAVVMPQVGVLGEGAAGLSLERVDAHVRIVKERCVVTISTSLINASKAPKAVKVYLPVPHGVRVEQVSASGKQAPRAEMLTPGVALSRIEQLAVESRNASPVEFAGWAMVEVSPLIVLPKARARVSVMYAGALRVKDGRFDIVLPRSERQDVPADWHLQCSVQTREPVAALYSPSHSIHVLRFGPNRLDVEFPKLVPVEPGSFRLSGLLQDKDGPVGTAMVYPEGAGGTFLLLLAPPVVSDTARTKAIPRELTLILDASASMHGNRMTRVRGATQSLLKMLREGERFNVFCYNQRVVRLSEAPVPVSGSSIRAAGRFMDSIKPRGGANLFEALSQALAQPATHDALPIVLLLTDGVPTVGPSSEREIRRLVTHSNPAHRRIFAVGLGTDVNTALLQDLAGESRGRATFVLASGALEEQLEVLLQDLSRPVFTGLEIAFPLSAAVPGPAERVSHLVPAHMPDLYAGGQLVLLGRYSGREPIPVDVTGNLLGEKRTVRVVIDPAAADKRNAFVPRLWAERRMAQLVARARSVGAEIVEGPNAQAQIEPAVQQSIRKLSNEIARLSLLNGVFNDSTAFVSTDVGQLKKGEAYTRTNENVMNQAVEQRLGQEAINFAQNLDRAARQSQAQNVVVFNQSAKLANSAPSVRHAGDLVLYRRLRQWVDSRLLGGEDEVPKKIIDFGTEAWRHVVRALAEDGRQGAVAVDGDVLLMVKDEAVLLRSASQAAY